MSDQPTQPQSEKAKIVPIRSLVINLLFSMFISLVIFAVASYLFLVPQMVHQKAELEAVKMQVQALTTDTAVQADEDQQAEPGEEANAAAPAGEQAAAPAADQAAAPAAGEAAPAAAAAATPAADAPAAAAAVAQ